MKILHIYKDYYPVLGGMENHVRVLAEAQAAEQHEVAVVVCGARLTSAIECRNGVRVVRTGRLFDLASMPISVAKPLAVARERADIVHVHSPYPLGELSAFALHGRTPLIVTHQADVVRQKLLMRAYGPVYRRILRRARRVIVTSPNCLATSRWLQPVRAKCELIPLGVDTTVFRPENNRLPMPDVLLFVGRFRHYKGLDTLLEAMALLPRTRLVLGGDGVLRADLERLAGRRRLDGRVQFLGEVPQRDLPSLYRAAGAFALPSSSRAEAFGMVLLEAMASGLPCVTTEVGTGTSWVVQDGVTGCVVPPNDPAALAAALGDLFDNPERRRVMGLAGRRRVEAHFTEQRMIERVMAVYRDCLAPEGRRSENRAPMAS